MEVLVNGQLVRLQYDLGADFTIISKETWKRIGCPPLQPTRYRAYCGSNKLLPILGDFNCSMTLLSTGQQQNGSISVAETSRLNLFGLDWHEKFNLDSLPIKAICGVINYSETQTEKQLLKEYPNVFSGKLGHCTKFKIHLPLNSTFHGQPTFLPARQIGHHIKPLVNKELDRLESEGAIERVEFSEWAAPIVVVKRADGRVRLCGDYSTGLNDALMPHPYPMKVPEDIFNKLNGCKYFTKIDLSDAYLQFEVTEETQNLLTIRTHRGCYRVKRLQPGVKPAPGAFQQAMDRILHDVPRAETFLDDIIIGSMTTVDHAKDVRKVFIC